ncbi:MAG: YjjG family noncanonical pyrimidine nucleotidase [Bacillota bacterium]|nr:YjjG family noncanonical pyrimidine nucleotidase [Bacillota bacterium]
MNPYRYLLFDADGTLFDFDRAEGEALKQTLQHHDLPWSGRTRDLYRDINQNLWQEFEQGLIDKDRLQTERFRRLLQQVPLAGDPEVINASYVKELGRCGFLFDDAEDICRRLAADFKLAIITNGIAGVQYPRFEKSPLAAIISDLFISEEIGYQKPQTEFFAHVLDALQIKDRKSALVIGDSLTADILGGINAGIDTCWYNPRHLTQDSLIRPTYEIDRLESLITLLA